MKKSILSIISIITLFTSIDSYANKNKMRCGDSEKYGNVINKLEGQEITEPNDLMEKWHKFKAKKLNLAAEEVKNVTKQIKDPAIKEQYLKVARTMNKLAEQLLDLPIPKQPLKKSLKNLKKWKHLKAEAMALKSEQLKVIADQTGEDLVLKEADRVERKAEKIEAALEAADKSAYKSEESDEPTSKWENSKLQDEDGQQEEYQEFAEEDRL
jgi:hypothetical protein